MSKIHKKALTYLNYGITSDTGGFILVTGEVGTGKTTIIRSIMKELKKDIIFSRVNNTHLTSEQLISMINEDFSLDVNDRDKVQMLRDLNDFLMEQYSKGRKSILIIDEAQNLTPTLLEEIRLLSNLETDKSKLLQIILIGQPELRKVLAQPGLRALRQRITVSCHIAPLLREETEKYIYHRLEIAGNRDAVSFEDGSIVLIHNFARGVPRLINIVSDFLLLSAFVDNTRKISLDMVKEVIDDLEKENLYWQDEPPENYSYGTKVPREMLKGLKNPEEVSPERDFNHIEKAEIFEKISETEKLLSSSIDRLKAELTNRDALYIDERLNDIAKEIKQIKAQSPKEQKGIASEIQEKAVEEVKTKNGKKKNLWAKLFRVCL